MRAKLFKSFTGKQSLFCARLITLVVMAFTIGVHSAYASASRYGRGIAYWKDGSPTAAGKVYVSVDNTSAPSDSQYQSYDASGISADKKGANTTMTFRFYAKANGGYKFTGWYRKNADESYTLLTTETLYTESKTTGGEPTGTSDVYTDVICYAEFIKVVHYSFLEPEHGSYTITNNGTLLSGYPSNVTAEGVVHVKATPADGYRFAGWYSTTDGGVTKNYFSFDSETDLTFTDDATICAQFMLDNGNALFYAVNGNMHDNLTDAITDASGRSPYVVTVAQDGRLASGNYTIPSSVTLLVQSTKSYAIQTTPEVVTATATLVAYRRLTMTDGANITCNGKICVAGKVMSASGGKKSSYVTGPCGVIDMSSGGHIELNNGAKLYCWGFIKGQDMDQGNNTTGVGTITANSGSEVWEDFAVGDWRGGSATEAINNKKSTWKLFPFQSYSIQNIEVPTTYNYNSTLKNYTDVSGNGGTNGATFAMIGNTNTLFKLNNASSFVRKWYDPTTDLSCYELSGTASMDALNLSVGGFNVSSSDFYLPISNSMHIIINSGCNLTLSKPMTMQAGSVIEIKSGATVRLESNLFMFDKDDWGKYIHNYYFRTFANLTNHKDRGAENSNTGIDDAKLIVDGTLNVISGKGYLYSTTGGADVMGNDGGQVIFGGSLPSSGTIYNVTVTSSSPYVAAATNAINSANLHNEDGSYTQTEGSKTYYNVLGRWFVSGKQNEKGDHTYDFTYISSGAVSGRSGTNTTTDAVYSWDKTGLTLRQKWFNVTADDACANWWHGQGDQSTWFYNWTENSAWHQFIPTETESVYGSSTNELYRKNGCTWTSLGDVDGDCLYTLEGVKTALVDGHFVALLLNDDGVGWHNAEDETDNYICFSGCNWHSATKFAGEEKAYIVDGNNYIWYNGDWLVVERETPYFFDYDATNVKQYYTYENGAWVLATPCVSVTDVLETRYFYFLSDAFTIANGKKNTTITLLKKVPTVNSSLAFTAKNTSCTLNLNGQTVNGTVSKLIDVNAAGSTFTITDNSDEKNGKISMSKSGNARYYGVYLTDGTLVLEEGTIFAENTKEYDKANSITSTAVSGVFVTAGKTFTMNGGAIEARGCYYPRGLDIGGSASANATVNVNAGAISATSTQVSTAMGIYTIGGTLNVKPGVTISATTQTSTAYGIFIDSSKNGFAGTVNMTGGTITAHTTTTTCYGVYVNVNATGTIPAQFTMSGGEVNVTTGTHTAYGIFVNRAAANSTNIYRAVADISGGIINVTSTTTGSSGKEFTDGIHSLGTTTITGSPEINVTATKTYARGIRVLDGTTTISGTPTVTVRATQYAYGVAVLGVAPDANGICSNAETVINSGTFDVATTSADKAYGALVQPVAPTADYESPSTLTINDGHFIVKAQTTTAQGVNCSRGTLMAGTLPNTLLNETLGTAHINGGTFDVSTLGTTTAQGITNSGNMTVENATFNVTPKSTTAYGARCYHGLLTINEGTVFNVKATNSAYGIVAGNEQPTTAGLLYDAEVVINGGTINVETTSTSTSKIVSYGLWAGGHSRTIATGTAYEGNYASAGKITVNDGEINVKAKTYPAYGIVVSGVVTQAGNTDYPAATATPQAFINGGKFKVTATSSKNYAISSTPLEENCQVTGGFYNTHTTQTSGTYIDKYVVSPKKKLALRSSHALYPAGYRYTVGEGGTVTWKNGTTTLLTEDYLKDETPAYTGATPTKTEPIGYTYTHTGWTPGIVAMNNSDAEYSATFSSVETKYSVTVAAGAGGSASPGSVSNIGCETASGDITATPSTGYNFVNWTLPDGVTAAAGYTVESNPIHIHATASGKTITANFAAKTYTVTLDNQAATTAGQANVTATYNAAMPSIATNLPEKTGYTFGGYFTETNGGGTQYYNADGTSAHVWDIDGEITLYAKWTLSAVTVIWKNGDEVIETDEGVLIGATPSFNGEAPTKATDASNGYTFDGWSDGTNVYAADALPAVSGPVTYTAHYSTTPTVASVKVGSSTTYYTDFAEAWDATNSATGAVTLKLLQDVSGVTTSLAYTNAQNCTLDLNNHLLKGAVNQKLLDINKAGCTFTITDSSTEQGGELYNEASGEVRYYGVYLTAGTLNLDAGTVHAKNLKSNYSSLTTAAKRCMASGVYVASGQRFNMNGGIVTGEAIYAAYGVESAGVIVINNGTINATTTKFTTARGIICTSTTTINGGTINATAKTTTAQGIYVNGGTTTLYGGDIEAYTTTKTCYGIYVNNGTLKIPSASTVKVTATAKTTTSVGVYVAASKTATIEAGTFDVTTLGTTTAYGVSSLGTTTIKGGTFNVLPKTTTARGVIVSRGTTTISGVPVFNVKATTSAYGAIASATTPGKTGTAYSGTLKIQGGTFNVETTSGATAYGVWANVGTGLSIYSTTGDSVPGNYIKAGIAEVYDGEFNVKAKTSAYGIVVSNGTQSANTALTSATAYGSCKVTGGKFKVETTDDANATAYAMNKTATAENLVIEGGYYNTKRTNASTTSNIEDKYTAPTKSCNYHVLDLPSSELPYKYEVAEAYNITFKDGDNNTIQEGPVKKDVTPAYTGETPTKTEDANYTYTFNNSWEPAIVPATAAATYTAQFDAVSKETGFWLDIIDVDNTNQKLVVNANNSVDWPAASWPFSINDVTYDANTRDAKNRLKIDYGSLAPGASFDITVKKDETVVSKHTYTIPQEVTNPTTLSTNAARPIFVKGTTLTIGASITAQNIYVGDNAKLIINEGATLTADTIFLRTTPEGAAELINQGTINASTQLCYTRIIMVKGQYYQFGLPLPCAISSVKLSDNATLKYTTGWLLRAYSESKRAAQGAEGKNWETLKAAATIEGGKGYEMYSGSNYYREFYFPVDHAALATNKELTVTRTKNGAAGEKHAGWNVLVSPLTYTCNNDAEPEDMAICLMTSSGWEDQTVLEHIAPAQPFAYQAAETGTISFVSATMPSLAPRHRIAAANEPTRIQWIRLDVKDANGEGDETSIYSHPTRYEEYYQTGIDVAKQSLTATRARLYSSHTYGDMAFAGVSDELFEQGVALTLYSPAAQELTFSLRRNDWLNRLEYVWIIDTETGAMIDLLSSDYTAQVTEGTTYGRFYISGRFHKPGIATDVENVSDSSLKGRAQKVLIEEKIYILVGDKLYDATGKLVKGK